jgi:hypothetical protein
MFLSKRNPTRALEQFQQLIDEMLSSRKQEFFAAAFETLSQQYSQLRDVDIELFIREVTAIHIELLAFAWVKAGQKRRWPTDHLMLAQIAIAKDSRLKGFQDASGAYNTVIGQSTAEDSNVFVGLSGTFVSRLLNGQTIQDAKGLQDHFAEEFLEVFRVTYNAFLGKSPVQHRQKFD